MGRLITLTTDFGLADGYVGTVKGVILGINPLATVVDITHEISPQDVFDAAFVLGTSFPYFPAGSVHVVVVDPEVGSRRRALAIATPRGTFVGPDNGVLTWAVLDSISPFKKSRSGRVVLPSDAGIKAVHLTKSEFWLRNPSRTFHGRDVFAPVAAYLSMGAPLESLGEEVSDVCVLPIPVPQRRLADKLVGEVLKVDHFGNLITNLKAPDLAQVGSEVVLWVAGREIQGVSGSYFEKAGLSAIIGSSGYLEIALKKGSAAETLKARRGTPVIATKLLPRKDRGKSLRGGDYA